MKISSEERCRLIATILAGFCANPAIFAHNDRCGWSLVNAKDDDIVGYALSLADKVVEADRVTRNQTKPQ